MKWMTNRYFLRSKKKYIAWAILLNLGGLLLLSGCQGSPGPGPAAAEPVSSISGVSLGEGTAPAAPTLNDDLARQRWGSSAHAQTFVTSQAGTNSDCARCHAPVEWIPSMDDLPESCFSCKFTVSPPPPVIPEDKWSHVNCNVCHEVSRKGERSPGIAWLEIAAIGEYSKPGSSTELCMKCHIGVDVAGHAPVELSGVHQELLCTHCHDAHTTAASCGTAGCHEGMLSAEVPGHDEAHSQISCAVCHDGNGWERVLTEEGVWGTQTALAAGGETVVRLRTSHNIIREADCSVCHFAGNPWGLEESLE
jgi:hypothetical protein